MNSSATFDAAGKYVDPLLSRNGAEKLRQGYLIDLLTDEACAFLRRNHGGKPFFLHLAHTAAHLPHQPRRRRRPDSRKCRWRRPAAPSRRHRRERRPGSAARRLCLIYNHHKQWRIPGRDTNLARPLLAIREGNWKLVIEGNNPPELYALDTDPGEARNLASQHPDLVARLQQDPQKWKAEMKPQVIAEDHPLYGKYKGMKAGPQKRIRLRSDGEAVDKLR